MLVDYLDNWSEVTSSVEEDSGVQDGRTNDFETISSYDLEDFHSINEKNEDIETVDCRIDVDVQLSKQLSVFRYAANRLVDDEAGVFHNFALEMMDVYPMLQYAWQQIREEAVFVQDRAWLTQEMNFFYRCVSQLTNTIAASSSIRFSKKKESLINKCNELLDLVNKSTLKTKTLLNHDGPLPISAYNDLCMSDYYIKCASMIVVAILEDHRPVNENELQLADFWNVIDSIEDSSIWYSKIDKNVKISFNHTYKN